MIRINLIKNKKICNKCKELKNIVEFNKDKSKKDGLSTICRDCCKKYAKSEKGRQANREFQRKFRQSEKGKIYIKEFQKEYRNKKDNKEKKKIYLIHYHENSQKYKERKKIYRKKFKETNKGKECNNRYVRNRRKNNHIYNLSCNVSRRIRKDLKEQHSSKDNKSCWNFLTYTPQKLKIHLESLWEPWMNWENYGRASSKKRTWQIDHIVPQSKLPYDSMEHPNFKKCWALENLRPLEALENIKKGNKLI